MAVSKHTYTGKIMKRPATGKVRRMKTAAYGISKKSLEGASKRVVLRKVTKVSSGARGYSFVTQFLDESGNVLFDDVSRSFSMSKGQLAETVGIPPAALHRTERGKAPKTQSRFREMLEIVGRVADWAGGKQQALAWYRAEPIPAFGNRTAEALVKEGKATAVRDYLDHVALGGFV
jgi:uncharacterized protein (DUF2384 family)